MKPQHWLLLISLLLSSQAFAQTGITSHRLGDGTGEDWEPAILADGSNVYAFWPHYAATALPDSAGATCLPFAIQANGNNGTTTSYMYFQSSSDGGKTWSPVSM